MRRLQYVALLTKFYLFDSDYSKYRFLIKSRYYTHTKTKYSVTRQNCMHMGKFPLIILASRFIRIYGPEQVSLQTVTSTKEIAILVLISMEYLYVSAKKSCIVRTYRK